MEDLKPQEEIIKNIAPATTSVLPKKKKPHLLAESYQHRFALKTMSSINKDSSVNIYNNTLNTNESLQNDGDNKANIMTTVNNDLTKSGNETKSRFAKNGISD